MNVLPCAGRAGQLDFAAEQRGQFTADGETQTGSAVFAAGAGIGLLEGFEDELLLFRRNADSGIADRNGNRAQADAKHRMIDRPPFWQRATVIAT